MSKPTVIIDTANGPVTINESAYDKDKHTLYVADPDPSIALDYKKQTVGWLKEQLTIKGINFDSANKKADFLTLYEMTHG